ncbi:MAG: L-threonylcarbamoyladenylate synthase, partial [Chitinimonas sp.]|nr:L-threonylcarbamoyladenylate synthase [Chitinimonas sp.]
MRPISTDLDQALALLQAGELVGIPTETVYGLAADASRPDAVAKIFAMKGRPADHPVIVHIAGRQQLADWAQDIPDAAWKLADAFWPGSLTLILRRKPHVPDAVTGGQDTVGLRAPAH